MHVRSLIPTLAFLVLAPSGAAGYPGATGDPVGWAIVLALLAIGVARVARYSRISMPSAAARS